MRSLILFITILMLFFASITKAYDIDDYYPLEYIDSISQLENPDTNLIIELIEYCKSNKDTLPKKTLYFSDKIYETSKNISYKKGIYKALKIKGYIYSNTGDYDNAKATYFSILKYLDVKKDERKIVDILNNIANIYKNTGKYAKAIKYHQYALNKSKQINYGYGIVASYNGIGVIYKNRGNYNKAIENYTEALKYKEFLKDSLMISKIIYNLGNIYLIQEKPYMAQEYFQKSLRIKKKLQDMQGASNALIAIGGVNYFMDRYEEALVYFKKALEIKEQINNTKGVAICYHNIANIFSKKRDYNKALAYYKKSLEIKKHINDRKGIAFTLNNIGTIYKVKKQYDKSIRYFEESLSISKKIGAKRIMIGNYEELTKIYEKTGNKYKAYNNLKQFSQLKDSLYNLKTNEQINELQARYETDKKNKELKLLKKDNNIQVLKSRQNKIITIILILGVVLILALIGIYIFELIQKQKNYHLLKAKNRRIIHQRDEIEAQKDKLEEYYHNLTCQKTAIEKQKGKIEEQNHYITSSIEYAKQIQEAILVPLSSIINPFPDSFVLYKPKDIVSGDFFWMEEKNNKIYFAAVDCTGHGVPGAFMSIIGHNLLNKTLEENNISNPAEILDKLNEKINNTFKSNNKDEMLLKDGMDLALCVYDRDTMVLEYAGAFNPLYIIRNKNLLEYKADCQPIEVSHKEDMFIPFTNHTIKVEPGDSLYILSDGFIDQFGGEKKRKFSRSNFRKTLINIQSLPMREQKIELDNIFENWRSSIDQMDDVLIVGIRFNNDYV